MHRSFVSLIVGITLAVMAVFLVSRYKGDSIEISKSNLEVVRIVVASQELPFGTKLIRDHLSYAEWPKGSVPEDTFSDMEPLLKDDEGSEESRIVIRSMFAGEPILKLKVSGFGNRPTLSRKVSENMRAFSISVNDVRGVAGFLLPGDKVDIMLTRSPSGSRGGDDLVTDVILQNVTILGIDQVIDERAEKPSVAKTATVEVDADQAQKLALAQQIGTLSLTLRNYSDNEEVSAGRITVGDLSAGGAQKKTASSSPGGSVIKIRRGTTMQQTRIP